MVSVKKWINETTIASGASVSSEIELEGLTLLGIFVPAAWTAANITFQISPDGGSTWADVRDAEGNELVLSGFSVGNYIVFPASVFNGIGSLRLRSGVSATPVNQGAARTIKYAIRSFI